MENNETYRQVLESPADRRAARKRLLASATPAEMARIDDVRIARRPTCDACDSFDHSTDYCPYDPDVPCGYCWEFGHTTTDCPEAPAACDRGTPGCSVGSHDGDGPCETW